jgi:large subunit ribosomal protein L35Ae
MEGIISSYRRGRHTQTNNQMIVVINEISEREKAEELVGKKVKWTTPAKKEMVGEVRSAHGKKGAIRVLFETGLPGQSLGTKVKIE